MKNLILFLAVLFISNFGFSQSEKTLVSNINMEVDELIVLIDGEKQIKHWNSDKVKIVFTIETNQSKEVLNVLTTSGRYSIESFNDGNVKCLVMPNLEKEVIIRGEKIQERIKFEIFVPSHIKLHGINPLQ
jgi:reverse gyrase